MRDLPRRALVGVRKCSLCMDRLYLFEPSPFSASLSAVARSPDRAGSARARHCEAAAAALGSCPALGSSKSAREVKSPGMWSNVVKSEMLSIPLDSRFSGLRGAFPPATSGSRPGTRARAARITLLAPLRAQRAAVGSMPARSAWASVVASGSWLPGWFSDRQAANPSHHLFDSDLPGCLSLEGPTN